jgi:hypothetical protein
MLDFSGVGRLASEKAGIEDKGLKRKIGEKGKKRFCGGGSVNPEWRESGWRVLHFNVAERGGNVHGKGKSDGEMIGMFRIWDGVGVVV